MCERCVERKRKRKKNEERRMESERREMAREREAVGGDPVVAL